MNDWLKVLVPVIIASMGVFIWDIVNEVKQLRLEQQNAKTWMYRVEQNELKIKTLDREVKQCSVK